MQDFAGFWGGGGVVGGEEEAKGLMQTLQQYFLSPFFLSLLEVVLPTTSCLFQHFVVPIKVCAEKPPPW